MNELLKTFFKTRNECEQLKGTISQIKENYQKVKDGQQSLTAFYFWLGHHLGLSVDTGIADED